MTSAVDAPPTLAADLVLLRLVLPTKTPAGPGKVRKDVGSLLRGHELTPDEFAAVRSELVAAGLMTTYRRSVRLTDAGRDRALAFLGVTDLPPQTTWQTIQAKYLFPRAAGISPDTAAKLADGEKVAAFLLKQQYDLPVAAGASLGKVMEALVCRELGLREETTLDGLLRAVLTRLIGGDEKLTKADLLKQLPRKVFNTRGGAAATLRGSVIREWLGQTPAGSQLAPQDHPAVKYDIDPTEFAATVQALARTSPAADRFHDNKAFIAAVWRASQREPGFPRMTLPEFKTRLVEANTRGLLRLSRADLVQAMDPALVAESETQFLNASFHFILIEGDRP